MADEEIAKLKRTRTSYKGHITKFGNKLKVMITYKTEQIDPASADAVLESVEKVRKSCQDIHDSLVERDPEELEEHDELLEAAQNELDELQETFTQLSRKGHACSDLECLLPTLDKFTIRPDSNGRKETKRLQELQDKFDRVTSKYRSHIRHDKHLEEVVDTITQKLHELSMEIPEEDLPPVVPVRRHAEEGGRDRHGLPQRRLPVIEIPKFNGDILEWEDFWTVFKRNVHTNADLDEDEKRTYLQQAIRDKAQSNLVDSLSGSYLDCVASLKARYDQPRRLHQHHTKAFFTCKPCKNDSRQELTRVHATLANAQRKLMDTKQVSGDALMESFAEGLLPPNLWRKWSEQERDQHVIPKMANLLSFLEFQSNLAQREPTEMPRSRREKEPPPEKTRYEKPAYEKRVKHESSYQARVHQVSTGQTCTACKDGGHPLYECQAFHDMTVDKRGDHVRKHRLCYNCLSRSHDSRDCHSTYKCKKCGKPHHTILHKEYGRRSAPEVTDTEETRVVAIAHAAPPSEDKEALIPTLQLIAEGPSGNQVSIRAILDTGAHVSIIRTKITSQLRLQCFPTKIDLSGAGELPIGKPTARVKVTLRSLQMPEATLTMFAYSTESVAKPLPIKKVKQPMPHLDGLVLADPSFRTPGSIDLILGNDVLQRISQPVAPILPETGPMATKTMFGWVVHSTNEDAPETGPTTSQCYQLIMKPSLAERLLIAQQEETELLRRFCLSEDVDIAATELTPEEKIACDSFDETHQILPSGRFQVTLPRKEGNMELGRSRTQAVNRFIKNEANLIKKGKWKEFQDVVEEYFTMKHAELVTTSDKQQERLENYYMPMHAVVKESSTTTKLRVVFDASATTSTGRSLNDTLVVGPTVHSSLCDVLMRFRTHTIAVTADVSKMYRAIELAPDERRYHRFVWRKHPDEDIRDYEMTRVTFGVAASPFLATRALKQAAILARDQYPQAAETIIKSFYVDDCIAGASTIEEAVALRKDVQTVLDSHDFMLRKWRSNSSKVMNTIPENLHEKVASQEAYGEQKYLKTLGIHWDAKHDNFYVSATQLQLPQCPTKRLLTSDIHRTFDVLGWFTPVTLVMKVLVQELWELKLDWNDQVPPLMQDKWMEWRSTLSSLTTLPIPRCYYPPGTKPRNIQLHGFADASTKAYGAAVYLLATYDDRPPTVTLVTAKSKLAPLKPMTVPRLELCGAYLLAQLITSVQNALDIPPTSSRCWTDSTIVLNWLDGSPRRYKTFAANRIVKITDLVPSSNWKHVPTLENPADCASRGMMPQDLIDHDLWWDGPAWLSKEPLIEPPQPARQPETTEIKIDAVVNLTTLTRPWLVLDFSKYERLRRVVAWIIRFIHNSQERNRETKRNEVTLTSKEVVEAEAILHRLSQERSFKTPLSQWEKIKELRPFHAFIDPQGRLRVGGRLEHSALTDEQKHPIILHGKDYLSTLIIRHQHINGGHAGPSAVMASLGREYHLFQGMKRVKAICQDCVKCKRHRVKKEVQLMGQLPAYRVTPGSPFSVVGTDFAGPLLTKYGYVRKPTRIKTYVCIFCCLVTKAVHLEAVTDLTTGSFLACLDRFVARRGKPITIHSDNGGNFVGAAKELNLMFKFMRTEQLNTAVQDYCCTRSITWKFNPERAPHHGGMWEAAVKSMKYHLRRIVGDQCLTYEELTTVLYKIEAMLNSRPLTPISSHSTEGAEVLTAGHFLIGRPLEAVPTPRTTHVRLPRKRWALCQELSQRFWDKWCDSYLQQLQRRNKWMRTMPNVRVNDVVLIREDGMFLHNWPMARVMEVNPGKDGLVRVAVVKTATSTFKRPITKLSILVSSDE